MDSKITDGKVVLKKRRVTDKEIADALVASGGVQSSAAVWLREKLGVIYSQQAISKRMKDNEMLQHAAAEGVQRIGDMAESKLIKAIQNDNISAIFFYLKCKCKDRGYVERQEINADVKAKVYENPYKGFSRKKLEELLKDELPDET